MQPEDTTLLFRLSEILAGPTAYTIGDVASMIERNGIYSWDRYGRFQCFHPESEPAQKALNLLAKLYELHNDPDLHPRYDFSDIDYELSCFCWPEHHFPDFVALKESQQIQPVKPKQSISGLIKTENASLAIIRGLLMYIKGEFEEVEAHPHFKSEKQLREFLDQQMVGFSGCASRNLADKFKLANQLIRKSEA